MEKGDIDVANDATGAMAKDAKSSNAGLKVLSAPSLDYGLIGFVSHDYDKKLIKLVKWDQNMKTKNYVKQCFMQLIEKMDQSVFQWLR